MFTGIVEELGEVVAAEQLGVDVVAAFLEHHRR